LAQAFWLELIFLDRMSWEEADGDLLWHAVDEASQGILELEKEWDESKLQKKLREYFNKGAKSLNFRSKPLWEVINEYADNVFGSLFAGLGDREWLVTGQADFILVLDAGIRDNFPKQALASIPKNEFEKMVLAAHDRSFEENRFGPILTEAVNSAVQGPKTKRRVWNAIEAGRKEAASSATRMEDFAACWINKTIAMIGEGTHGDPESVITADSASELFHSLIEGGGLPLAMTQESGHPPRGWPLIDEAVQTAYITHVAFENGAAESGGQSGGQAPPAKRRKAAAQGPFSAF